QSGGDAHRDFRSGSTRPSLWLHLRDEPQIWRDRGHHHRGCGGGTGLRPDQDRIRLSHRPRGQVQPAAADRGAAWRRRALRRPERPSHTGTALSEPRILVSNDDGHLAEGLLALAEAMSSHGEVWVVAPAREQSAASHSLSLQRPLRIKQIRTRWYAIDGTPSDCSCLAINHLMKDGRPALMVSGINHGPNLADDVTYSG